MRTISAFILFAMLLFTAGLMGQTSTPAASSQPVSIDIAHTAALVFDDPIWHGASDPFVIRDPVSSGWLMYYTQRRATLENANGVDWVHGCAIGVAVSADGKTWTYAGTCKGDHDLSDPLAARGKGPEAGVTWWAPCFLQVDRQLHMWVVLVDGVYTGWTGQRHIVHFVSDDGRDWKYKSIATLSSERVIDPTVYRAGDHWYMVYKDESKGSRTYVSQSDDLEQWTDARPASPDGHQEAPFVFDWKTADGKDRWWMMVDKLGGQGLGIYQSPDGIDGWVYQTTILNKPDGTRMMDNFVGHHPGIVLQPLPGGGEQCLVFYFTQQQRKSVIQLTELTLDAAGKPICDRNRYAPPTTRP